MKAIDSQQSAKLLGIEIVIQILMHIYPLVQESEKSTKRPLSP